ncbi:YaiO family outer membrane beta-barrel protein [Aquiflexum gelatinilyticum]|uniref:YaiO family outer membrane beta-barrel protein n=1 Tax=Aquiflexum gelatinilyticum TaxID=2961943 RepID=A0A9X2P7S9_9BACT|nr:YaiO family outer membrane beta-barrel protein [Aquiflexum gelatinilyticum]MCR9014729.1 YaiO family outer membrane beta-barrel protein [Aquiflexum gelatinilyticum]
MRNFKTLLFYGFLSLALSISNAGWAQESFDPDQLFLNARKLILDGKRDEGREILYKVLKKYPEYGDVLILMGRSFAWDGKYDSAAIYFERALVSSTTYEDAYIAYIDDLFWSENYEKADSVVQLGLEKIGPQSMDLKYRYSRLLYYKEDYKSALKIANEVFAKAPKTEGLLGYIETLRRKTRINAVGATYDYDYFYGELTPWNTYTVYGRTHTDFTGSLIARVTHSERFDGRGTQAELDAFPSLGKNKYGYFNVGYSQSSFFPKFRFGTSVFWNLPKAYELEAGYRLLQFSDITHIITASAGKYISNWWLNLRLNFIPGKDGSSTSANFQTRYYFNGPEDFFSLQLSTGVSPDEETRDFQSQLLNSYRARFGYQHLWTSRWMGFGFVGYSRDEISENQFRNNLNVSLGTEFRF